MSSFLSAYNVGAGGAAKSPGQASSLKAANRGGAEALRKKPQPKVKLEVII